MNQQKEIIVVGHKSPDTDSICSAKHRLRQSEEQTDRAAVRLPRRAGDLNKETAFALSYFSGSRATRLSGRCTHPRF